MSVVIDPKAAAEFAKAFRGTDLEALQRRNQRPDVGPGNGPGINPVDQFANMLKSRVSTVNETMAAADDKVEAYVRGQEDSVHDVMIAMSKADINFKLMTQVGRKVIEAYQEIMRMQV